ncbi:unnamed protein product [Discula destructiva]
MTSSRADQTNDGLYDSEEERELQEAIRLSLMDRPSSPDSFGKGSSSGSKRDADKELSPPPLKRSRVEKTSTSHPSEPTMAFPNGALRMTRTAGRKNHKNCINLGDLIDKNHLVSACVYAFYIARQELFRHLPFSKSSNDVPIYIGRDSNPNMDEVVGEAAARAGIDFGERLTKKQFESLVPALRQLCHERYGKNCHDFYAWSSGSCHSKILVLVYPTFLRVVITSCNMMDVDTELNDNHWYIHDLPKLPSRNTTLSDFETGLLAHLEALRTPQEFLDSIQGKYDYSTVKAKLVTSVPGVHSGPKAENHGLLRLRRVVKDLDLNLAEAKSNKELRLEICAASIGNLNAKWLDGFFNCAIGRKSVEVPGADCEVPKELKLFYPTTEDVNDAEGEPQPGSGNIGCHTRPWPSAPKQIQNLFHHYHSKDAGRIHHQKLIMAYNPEKAATASLPHYVYVGSANLSQSAWGALEHDKRGNEATCDLKLVKTTNYECGVVVSGDQLEALLEPGTKSWQDGIVPYVQTAEKYDLSLDKPWNDPLWVKDFVDDSKQRGRPCRFMQP